eukprot:m.184183 g.184183  ORF g.184183 m.184183 type:complete len:220 (-) comp53517_c0_seq5:116-775(-)
MQRMCISLNATYPYIFLSLSLSLSLFLHLVFLALNATYLSLSLFLALNAAYIFLSSLLFCSLTVLFCRAAYLLALEWPSKVSVILTASQKSLSVSISVLAFLPASLGSQGLMTVSMLIGHVSQIFVDSILVAKLAEISDRYVKDCEDAESGLPLVEIEDQQSASSGPSLRERTGRRGEPAEPSKQTDTPATSATGKKQKRQEELEDNVALLAAMDESSV